jgi:hypothetical protein
MKPLSPAKEKHLRKVWKAMRKFCDNEGMSENDLFYLSHLTLIDRDLPKFGPTNTRWVKDEAEHLDNYKFYRAQMEMIH